VVDAKHREGLGLKLRTAVFLSSARGECSGAGPAARQSLSSGTSMKPRPASFASYRFIPAFARPGPWERSSAWPRISATVAETFESVRGAPKKTAARCRHRAAKSELSELIAAN